MGTVSPETLDPAEMERAAVSGPPESDLLHEKALVLGSGEEQNAALRRCSRDADPQRPRRETTVPSAHCAFFRDNSLPEKQP